MVMEVAMEMEMVMDLAVDMNNISEMPVSNNPRPNNMAWMYKASTMDKKNVHPTKP